MNLTHFSLFTGIGGIDLAAEWAGFETVGQCEWANYPTKVLEKHWPGVPRWRDIRSVTKESFTERTGLRTVTLISGGFPCQPFSVAGKRRGENDDRHLWPEMFRIIREIRPNWVLGENVVNFTNMALEETISNLETQNYEVRAFIIPACAAEAPHKRERVFIVAYNKESNGQGYLLEQSKKRESQAQHRGLCSNTRRYFSREWPLDSKSRMVRVVDGISRKMDKSRLECLGNAVVPQQIYPILAAIAATERSLTA